MWDALQSCTKLNTYSLKNEHCEVGGSYIQVNTKLQLPILCLSILRKYQQLESKQIFDSSEPANQTTTIMTVTYGSSNIYITRHMLLQTLLMYRPYVIYILLIRLFPVYNSNM